MVRNILPCLFLLCATTIFQWLPSENTVRAAEPDLLHRSQLVAWCIVPFDAKQRGPAERAQMLKELGIRRCAYDWRAEHVPTFEQEILEYKRHGIELFAFWRGHEAAFDLFQKYDLHPQIWQIIPTPDAATEAEKVAAAVESLLPLVQRTRQLGCKLALYNHGGWSGEPKNMVAVCRQLRQAGHDHVGIVYNFHHGHQHIADWEAAFPLMQPYLMCLNINGMNPNAQPKILGLGKGQHELDMLQTVIASGYDGPIGILDHRNELDTRESLQENLDGLQWIRREVDQPGSGGPKPTDVSSTTPPNDESFAQLVPGADAYRKPPITVECRITLQRSDQYNILVASDSKQSANHWELFSMNQSGRLTAYLPGKQPDHVTTDAMICDRKPHTVAMIYEPDRIRLFVDGKQVADQAIVSRADGTARPGGLGIGRLIHGGPRLAGKIDWLRISRGALDIADRTSDRVQREPSTIGFWDFRVPAASQEAQKKKLRVPPPLTTKDPPYDEKRVATLVSESLASGDPLRGAAVFADAKFACLSCHQVGKFGGTVGPALSKIGGQRQMKQIVESVLWPQREIQPEYQTWKVLTLAGKIVTGYQHDQTDQTLTIRDPASDELHAIDKQEIDQHLPAGSLMPAGLLAAMTDQQQLDLFCFLGTIGRGDAASEADFLKAMAPTKSHLASEFPLINAPLQPENYRYWQHPVNRDRLFDFYTKQADYFAAQPAAPMLIAPFPGLDGGQQGHWGNQNEETWADDRWNDAKLGSLQAGVFRGGGVTVARGVCVRLGQKNEISACFNPDTLRYDAIWSGGFVRFDSVRHGFVGGMKMQGAPLALPRQPEIDQPFSYKGYYRHGNRVIFAYTIDGVDYLDSPWVEDGKFVRQRGPAETHPLRQFTRGGPSQWPQELVTAITPGQGRPFAIDRIDLPVDNPWQMPLFCGDHDFLSDGSALVCTMQGDVWRVSGLDGPPDEPGQAQWRRFASGLHHALGLVVADDRVYVQCRDQLTRLTDLNNDGEADFYECFSNAFKTSAAGHDYICGLQRDRDGHFYTASGNQGILRISPDGKHVDVLATGFRNPDGLGIIDSETLTVPVSEGSWTPASMIHAVDLKTETVGLKVPHYGYGGPRNGQPPELPLAYLPRGLDNSSGGQTQVPPGSFGPLADHLLHFSFGTGAWFVVLRDEVNGQAQGAVVPMAGDFASGAHRGRFHPIDGQLYVSGMSGWGSYTPSDGCFERVRYTGGPVQVPVGFRVHQNGIVVRFSEPLDQQIATNVRRQFAQCWNYRYSGGYGSAELSTTHPGVVGHDPLSIESAHILDDGRSLFLEIPDLQPVNQLHLRLHVNKSLKPSCNPAGTGHDLFVTVHEMDAPFRDFPRYSAHDKTIAAHPMLTDLAMNAAAVANPWHKKIAKARTIELETGKNLTFATRQIEVLAGQPIELRLLNPDVVPHNWVLIRPGTLPQIGRLANALIADPSAFARQYVPESDDVLVHTDIVAAGQQQSIYFHAPSVPGEYPFLCTFPGHWMVMNGIMVVRK